MHARVYYQKPSSDDQLVAFLHVVMVHQDLYQGWTGLLVPASSQDICLAVDPEICAPPWR
jgi:hypothetical protein